MPRGQPLKPRQSGYALWVGNLPPRTTITQLKDYFSTEATRDIESVYYIARTNCAFVNYRTEIASCAALNKFHNSCFHGVRIICRLRRTSSSQLASDARVAPLATTQLYAPAAATSPEPSSACSLDIAEPAEAEGRCSGVNGSKETKAGNKRVVERFFILKSLTTEDLERSVRTGVWATQSHNEGALNKAYKVRSIASNLAITLF